MNGKTISAQYRGCDVVSQGRRYDFVLREAAGTEREFCLLIENEVFNARRARFQDAAEICSIRLQQELLAEPEQASCGFRVTEADLDSYRTAHTPVRNKPAAAVRRKMPKRTPYF